MLYLLPHALDNTAARLPEKEAIRCFGKSLTYEELALRSSSLARVLREHGVRRGDRVGTFMNKSLEAVVSVYGIMKAGAACVPLDPFSPPARLSYVIKDCGIRCVISKADKLSALEQIFAADTGLETVLGVDEEGELPIGSISWETIFETPPLTDLYAKMTEHDISYIIYTSGSTGNPKGIAHTHRTMLNFALWGGDVYSVSSEDRLGNHTPFHFAPSTFDLFSSALAGATTVLIPEAIKKFPASVSKLLAEERISIYYTVPFAIIQLLEHGSLHLRDLSALRWVIITGEMFRAKHLNQLMAVLPQTRISNQYGCTEAYTCTYYHVPHPLEDSGEAIPIGVPRENMEDLVIDEDGQPVEPGEVGELLIRSGTVMRGYWGQPEKNEQSFYRRKNPSGYDDLFFRTRDRVQLLPDGNYRHCGRKDRMIKLRGYRVELDEVETVLLSHPLVQEAAVYTVPDTQESMIIEASVIPKQSSPLAQEDLVGYLADRLPPYAIPARIDILDNFPRTSTGKTDRLELEARAVARNTQLD